MLLELLVDLADFVLQALFGWRFYSGSECKQRAEMVKQGSQKDGGKLTRSGND
jgi:hypothetical protein